MAPIRILVIDDHQVVRDGLRWILGEEPDLEIAGEAASAAEGLDAIARIPCDVVLLDIHLPDRNGLEALDDIHAAKPDLPVVILTMSAEPEYVEDAVRKGAAGYLVKNAPQAELIRAIRAAAAGDVYIQAEVTRPLLARFARDVRAPGAAPALSPREEQVVSLLAEGLANKQIAHQLGISETTVKGYLRDVYDKLGANDRAQAVAISLRNRLID
jgi:DNA-binding NarL/FixJ family response regulator